MRTSKITDLTIFDRVPRAALSRMTGLKLNVIYQMAGGFLDVSPSRALDIEQKTGGLIRAEELRPDIFKTKRVQKRRVA